MADINQIITLGVGTPSSVKHFILIGLTPAASASAGRATQALLLGVG